MTDGQTERGVLRAAWLQLKMETVEYDPSHVINAKQAETLETETSSFRTGLSIVILWVTSNL